jgi:hypothetical protein
MGVIFWGSARVSISVKKYKLISPQQKRMSSNDSNEGFEASCNIEDFMSRNGRLLEMKDSLLQCRTLALAKKYINDTLLEATKFEKFKIARAYFGAAPRKQKRKPERAAPLQRKRQKGGQSLNVGQRLIDMIAAAEVIHDFGDKDHAQLTMEGKLPNEIPFHILAIEKNFINKLAKERQLTFGDETVENPLFGETFLKIQD